MRATLFNQPLELKLTLDKEEFNQGDTVKGHLEVTNYSQKAQSMDNIQIALALGVAKKIKAKQADAFTPIESTQFEKTLSAPAQQTKRLDFAFQLSQQCPITEKSKGPYIMFGDLSDTSCFGHLQLQVNPLPLFDEFLRLFDYFYRFKCQSKKSKNGPIEAKLIVPKSKEFSTLENLSCQLQLNRDQLEIKYLLKAKKLAYSGAGPDGVKVEKKKLEFNQSLSPAQYLSYGKVPNQDGILQAIESILSQVKTKTML